MRSLKKATVLIEAPTFCKHASNTIEALKRGATCDCLVNTFVKVLKHRAIESSKHPVPMGVSGCVAIFRDRKARSLLVGYEFRMRAFENLHVLTV